MLCACGGSVAGDDSGTGSDAATGMDGGTIQVDGGTSISDPGSITCGAQPCAISANYCCDEANGEKCVPLSFSSCGGPRRACDEAADCTMGSVCCYGISAAIPLTYSTECAPPNQCGDLNYRPQVCKTSSECTNGQPCVLQTCKGKPIRTCGMLPSKHCPP